MKTHNRHAQERAASVEKGIRKGELAGVRYLMQDAVGRALAWRYLQVTGADRAVPFSPNAMQIAHDAGVQEAGHWLLAEIREACPEQESVMRKEARGRDERLTLAEEQDE